MEFYAIRLNDVKASLKEVLFEMRAYAVEHSIAPDIAKVWVHDKDLVNDSLIQIVRDKDQCSVRGPHFTQIPVYLRFELAPEADVPCLDILAPKLGGMYTLERVLGSISGQKCVPSIENLPERGYVESICYHDAAGNLHELFFREDQTLEQVLKEYPKEEIRSFQLRGDHHIRREDEYPLSITQIEITNAEFKNRLIGGCILHYNKIRGDAAQYFSSPEEEQAIIKKVFEDFQSLFGRANHPISTKPHSFGPL